MPSYDDTISTLWDRIRALEATVARLERQTGPPRDMLTGGGPAFHYGKMDAAIGPAETKVVSLWSWNGTTWVDSTVNVDASTPPLLSSGSIAIGKWVRVWFNSESNRWEIDMYEC